MAFVLLGPIGRYLCASGDVKPTTGIATGSVCQETDTGKVWWFNGAAWVEQVASVAVTGSLPSLATGANIIGAVKQDVPNWTPVRSIGDYTEQQAAASLWDPTEGKKFVITDIVVSTATAGTITLLDDDTIIREYKLAANGGAVENLVTHEMSDTADNILKVTTSAALDCFIVVKGYEV